jgi:hypothetical protein
LIAVYPGDIIRERWAKSSQNAERHQIGLAGDIIPDSRATSSGNQHSNEPERKKFEKLPVGFVKFLNMADSQAYLILLLRDLYDKSFICSPAITRQVIERFGDCPRRPGKVEKKTNGANVYLCRDVQPEELVIRLCRGQLKEPILGSGRKADLVLG